MTERTNTWAYALLIAATCGISVAAAWWWAEHENDSGCDEPPIFIEHDMTLTGDDEAPPLWV